MSLTERSAMTDELKKAIHQWIDIEHRFSLERRPDRAIDRTKVFEMSPLKEKEDLDFFLHIRIGDYSFCATVGSDGAFHGFWNTIPEAISTIINITNCFTS